MNVLKIWDNKHHRGQKTRRSGIFEGPEPFGQASVLGESVSCIGACRLGVELSETERALKTMQGAVGYSRLTTLSERSGVDWRVSAAPSGRPCEDAARPCDSSDRHDFNEGSDGEAADQTTGFSFLFGP